MMAMTNAANKLHEAGPGDGDGASSVLQDSIQNLVGLVTERALSSVSKKVSTTSDRLNDYATGNGEGGLLAAVTGSEKQSEGESSLKSAISGGWEDAKQTVKDKTSDVKEAITGGGGDGGGSGKGKKLKLTNIVESIDVGVPVRLAYDQWTQFADFPSFMKKVERVEQESDEKLEWKAQVFLSHRTWESSILEQVPDERIVWRSKGAKGYVDGAVTFHEMTPDLTRILLILEYHPKGFFEKTGNLWRAPGRRVRLELKHFGRHIMTQAILHPDDVEGWRGEIRDGKVVEDEPDEAEEDETLEDNQEAEEPDDSAEEDAEEPEDTTEEDTEEPDDSAEEEEEKAPPKRRGRPRKTAAAKSTGSRQGARR
jgi:uncharacterized membrane protein